MAKKFYEVQSHIVLTGHITESMVTVIGSHVWNKLTPDEQKIFADALKEAAAKATEAIEASERILAGEFRSSATPWSSLIARRSARRRSRCTTMPPPAPAGPRRSTTSCRR